MIDKERITRQFVKLVSIDAPSYREREMADYLTKELEELGFSVEEDDAWKVYGGNCGNLYAHRPGSGSPLLLGMHMESEHRSMYSYVRLSIDRCTATYV